MSGVETFTAALAAFDPALSRHGERVCSIADVLADRLGWEEEMVDSLRLGAALHDVGKVNLRAGILTKPGRLDADEVAHVQTHPIEGLWLVGCVRSLQRAAPYILFHHERWDGKGYPTRRRGPDIPLEGRLLAVADAFDAMTSPRPYRSALTFDEAVNEVRRGAGTQFDPQIAEAFLDAAACGAVAPAVCFEPAGMPDASALAAAV